MSNLAMEYLAKTIWAIGPDFLSSMQAIAERENEIEARLTALEQKAGRELFGTEGVTIREDGIAVISIRGPLFRYANLMTAFCGATSYQTLARDIRAAEDNPAVTRLAFAIDSPGGEVNGCWELAKQIASVSKPTYAYIGGAGASGAYWTGSAADHVFAAETALIGSIGVMGQYQTSDERPGKKTYTIVSNQSPLKNAGPDSEQGRNEIQRVLNELAGVFIASVAKNRGVSVAKVESDFGRGSVFTGKEAEKRHMVDEICTFEEMLSLI